MKTERAKNPPQVMTCTCVAALNLVYKTGSKMHGLLKNFFPLHTRSNGATFQDQLYGFGRRLHNPGFIKGKLVNWICTCCGEKKRV